MARKATQDLTVAAKALGRAGGLKGGPARARALSKQDRVAIAKKGGEAARKKRR